MATLFISAAWMSALLWTPADGLACDANVRADVQPCRVNTFTSAAQAQATIARDGAGNIAVAWSSRRQQGGRSSVYMQRFAPAGQRVGVETPLSLWGQSHQTSPAVAASPDGTLWAVWQSHAQDGDAGSIIARRFDIAAPDFAGSDEILVNQWQPGDQHSPVVAAGQDGSAVIAWTHVLGCDGQSDVRLRAFDATGRSRSDEIIVPCGKSTFSSGSPALAASSDGGFALLFAVTDEAMRPAGLRLQLLDACGQPEGEPVAVDVAGRSAIEPVIVTAPFGFVIGWLRSRDDGADFAAMMQRYNDAGAAIGTPVVISDDAAQVSALAVEMVGDSIVAMWNAVDVDTGVTTMFARAFTHLGESLGAAERLYPHLTGPQQLKPASGVARLASADGTVLSVWNGDGGGDDDTGVYLSRHRVPSLESVAFASDRVDAIGLVLALLDASPQQHFDAPEPHVPPTFDRAMIDKGDRVVVEGARDIGFTGILSTGWTPPDPHMAAGPEHLVLVTNGAIAFLNKTGQLLFQQSLEGFSGFWGALTSSNFIFDPEVLYDELSGRFFAMACERPDNGTQSFVLVAVSDDSNPMGGWHRYRFDVTNTMAALVDSPNIGVDEDVVYITADRGSSTVTYGVHTFDKASLLAGAPPADQAFSSMATTTESAGLPAVSFDDPPALYLIEHEEGFNNDAVRLIALTNPLGTHIYTSTTLRVPAYGPPENPPQMGTSVRPITFDARFWSVGYRNGSLWATHHINATRVLVRWYEIAMNGWPTSGQQPALVQSGVIDPGPGVRTFFGAITADAQNNAAIVFAQSSPSQFISMRVAVRAHDDPPGTFREPVSVAANTGPYTIDRWGDYAGIVVDPSDRETFWAHHEVAVGSLWQTWVAGITPDFGATGDVDGDGDVDVDDLVAVILAWGDCPPTCPADLDADGDVDVDDLVIVILNWG